MWKNKSIQLCQNYKAVRSGICWRSSVGGNERRYCWTGNLQQLDFLTWSRLFQAVDTVFGLHYRDSEEVGWNHQLSAQGAALKGNTARNQHLAIKKKGEQVIEILAFLISWQAVHQAQPPANSFAFTRETWHSQRSASEYERNPTNWVCPMSGHSVYSHILYVHMVGARIILGSSLSLLLSITSNACWQGRSSLFIWTKPVKLSTHSVTSPKLP